MAIASVFVLLATMTSMVMGHGTCINFTTNGVEQGGFNLAYYYDKVNHMTVPQTAGWYAEDLDSGFVAPTSYATADIICHKNASPGSLTATVKAGSTVKFQWTTWPHTYGPVLTYVANCNGDCTKVDKTTLKWVKIDASGINLSTQVWASQVLINNDSTWTTTVPASLAPGNYVFRHEIIALHGAGTLNGAQNYPQCVNIAVTGSGTQNPEGVLATTMYHANDPGIYFNPYTTLKNYTMPGPALWTG